ncbi:MAG TPA: nitroreductase family protein [Desulfomonilaceae bacterium]|nr:nitroreductase family protein [Desulfomonilaceae bacterium]
MEFRQLMETRRSVNYFDPNKTVSDEELRKMVELATLIPSSFNLQPWNLIVVRSPADKARLRKRAWDQFKVTQAPVVLIVLADKDGYKEGHPTVEQVWDSFMKNGYMKPEQRDYFLNGSKQLYGENEMRSLAFAAKNAAFFGLALMLAAKELGIDTHPMDGFDHDGVVEEFSIPKNFFVPMLIAVGHFDENKQLLPRNWRKPYDEIVIATY